ncbi:ribonuclease R [Oxobacter pfennigii]|uniref:Ribonuclease R n=1 Tax=Oxobacter pfennigii TaxID=36849 RepID=A0A0N8NTM4_9CLOT|nr:ribonuclease R [Oxobacter pfennigii]KPU45240.1 ribonuclease R [Oxobacter pfennigii]
MKNKEDILNFMKESAYNPMLADQMAELFEVKKSERSSFYEMLNEMEAEGLIIKTRKNRYGVPERMNLVVGKLQGHQKGFGFIIPDDENMVDIYISADSMNGAMNNDRVIGKITKSKEGGKRAEGEIIRIIKRATNQVIGTFESNNHFGFVIPDDKRISQDIFVPKTEINGAETGHKVVVEITKWPEPRRNPEGKIIEILGHKGQPGIDILSVIRKYGLPEEFPEDVQSAAEAISETIPQREYERREDLRNLKIVTIDGEDAKDLDDAVSIEKLSNGNYKLGVHIADVSYYVRENDPIDKEAQIRGTSVYLIDRVVPMLPKKLSNGICSLNPKVDRLTMTCMMEIDGAGKVVDHRIFESIIKTNERMTYTDVTKILKDNDPEVTKRYDYLIDDFKLMEELCGILRKKRMARGSIDFDFPESKITLDDRGKPIDVRPYTREIANMVIEEFMLVANETVAEHMYWTELPFIYRIHEDPDPDKMEAFNEFIHNFGYYVKGISDIHPKALQDIIQKVAGKKEEVIINTLMLRSLRKAKYSPECLGHFGLAAKYYTHFTSPIRRYPDLTIHRIIREFLNDSLTDKRIKKLEGFVKYAAKQSSETEITATEAEREVDDLKKAEYMQDRIGEVYDGIITSVTPFGMFVELENTIEGLVHVSSLVDDYYFHDEKHHSFIGEVKRKIYRLGDLVKIKVSKVNVDERTIDFVLEE